MQKCPYCDFNSHGLRGELPEARYLDALVADVEAEAARAPGRTISSVFIGGGTPSLFSAEAIARLLTVIDRTLGLDADAEITLEANPGTAEAERFAGYVDAGVNRLSLGLQSLNDARLKRLGRIHSVAESMRAFGMARAAGFDNINVDMMFGLPGQSTEAALAELDSALAFEAEHLSWYQLTLEPNTRFAAQPPSDLPDDDTLADMQQAGVALLAAGGYTRYEVSAYARAGRRCRHNLNYWRFGDYLAAGAGAHGKLTEPAGRVHRRWKHRHPNAFIEASDRTAETLCVAADQLPFEFMLNALRLLEGVEAELYAPATGLEVCEIESVWGELESRGLVAPLSDGRLVCTETGYRWLNDVVAAFLPE